MVNNNIAKAFYFYDSFKKTFIVQRNKFGHMINQLQVKLFARYIDSHLILFLVHHV